MLAAEHLLDFGGLDLLIERLDRLSEFSVHGFAGFGPFDQNGQVVALLPERHQEIPVLFEPPAALQDFLRFSLIFPEVWRGGARLQAGQFLIGPCGLKDSSADRQRVC
jgi:hypothetical protein